MKKLAIAFVFLVTPALAQQSQQEIQDQANAVIQALQTQRNAAMDQAAGAQVQNAKLQKELDAVKKELAELKAPKPNPEPKP